MGYSTHFSLRISIDSGEAFEDSDIHEKLIGEATEYGNGLFDQQLYWHDHEEDMKSYSQQYPNMIFELYGEGEESGDTWFKYFKNGRMQVCPAIITYDEFNIHKLK